MVQLCEHYHWELGAKSPGIGKKIIEPEFGSAEEGALNWRGLLPYYHRDAV